MNKNCKTCGEELILGVNYTQGYLNAHRYYCNRCYDLRRKPYNAQTRYVLKMEILTHYGGTPPRCAKCGEQDLRVLCLDHINGEGNRHRNSHGGVTYYRWLRNNSFPEGFQILCANCNMKKEFDSNYPDLTKRMGYGGIKK